MNGTCTRCGTELIWDNDFEDADYGMMTPDGIVSIYHCPNCQRNHLCWDED